MLAVGGTLGFLTFLSYLGTGYLDSWHGLATLVLLPLFVLGLARSRPRPSRSSGIRSLLTPGERPPTWSRAWLGIAFQNLDACFVNRGESVLVIARSPILPSN